MGFLFFLPLYSQTIYSSKTPSSFSCDQGYVIWDVRLVSCVTIADICSVWVLWLKFCNCSVFIKSSHLFLVAVQIIYNICNLKVFLRQLTLDLIYTIVVCTCKRHLISSLSDWRKHLLWTWWLWCEYLFRDPWKWWKSFCWDMRYPT